MTLKISAFGFFTALLLACALILADVHSASAQNTRHLTRRVGVGKQIEFTWTNYDARSCRDNGYAKFAITRKPTLGKFRVVRKKTVERRGRCKGKSYRTLLIYYVAGRKKGNDRAAFAVTGGARIETKLNIRVR